MKAGDTCPACNRGKLRGVLGKLLQCWPWGCTWERVFGRWIRIA